MRNLIFLVGRQNLGATSPTEKGDENKNVFMKVTLMYSGIKNIMNFSNAEVSNFCSFLEGM